MSTKGLVFHHLGLACDRPDRSVAFLRSLGYEVGEPCLDVVQNVNLIMCTSATMPAVEVIWPAGPDGPLKKVLESAAEGVYHICYSTCDRGSALAALISEGHRLMPVSPPKPAALFGGQTVSFHFLAGFGLIEVLETPTHESE